MHKSEVITRLAYNTGVAKMDVNKVVEAFITLVSDTLKEDQSITLMGFGTFKTVQRGARTGHNPRTQAKIAIPAQKIAKFLPGKALKAAVVVKKPAVKKKAQKAMV